jgi:beta-phosphoglucomutase-like phosphatase (HAD superfamily)
MIYDAVIFDCNGVLVDSETLSCAATADTMKPGESKPTCKR